jgi:predicted sulfurtransferase
MKTGFRFLLLLFCLLGLSMASGPALAANSEVKYIDPATLKAMMQAPDVVVIDTSQGWWTYDKKIPGSLVFPEETSSWAPQLKKNEKIVLYCG